MLSFFEDIAKLSSYVYSSLPGVPVKEVEKIVVKEVEMLTGSKGRYLFIRMAGLSGAIAVGMAAYGAHGFKQREADTDEKMRLKEVFDSGNRMHLIHSVALLGVPLTRKPLLVGTCMTAGIILFSGSCYVHALINEPRVRKVTPYGGMLLILSWLAMML